MATLSKSFHPGPVICRGPNETRQKDWSEREWARDLKRPDDHSRLNRMRDEHSLYEQRYTPRFKLRGGRRSGR